MNKFQKELHKLASDGIDKNALSRDEACSECGNSLPSSSKDYESNGCRECGSIIEKDLKNIQRHEQDSIRYNKERLDKVKSDAAKENKGE
jgi:protein-arginine kinase activator protein McsA